MREDVTRLICEKCKKLPDECECNLPEEPVVREWDDLTQTWQKGEVSL